MPSDGPDRVERQLVSPILDDLFDKPLDQLAGDSCRDRLLFLIGEAWRQLVERSCARHGRPMPEEVDAIHAVSALERSLREDSPIAESLLPDPSDYPELTGEELRRYLSLFKLKHWVIVLGCVATSVAIVFGFGLWLGTNFF